MTARFKILRSLLFRRLTENQQIRGIYHRSFSSLLIYPQNAVSQFNPPISLTIPSAACVFSSSCSGVRSYSSHSEAPSNVVLVRSDDHLKDSLKEAEDESSRAVFYFTAAWCGPCQFLWPDMKKLSENLPGVKFYKIDIDEVGAGPTISKLSIFSVPTLHFFKDGKKAAEVVGADVKKIKDISSALYKE